MNMNAMHEGFRENSRYINHAKYKSIGKKKRHNPDYSRKKFLEQINEVKNHETQVKAQRVSYQKQAMEQERHSLMEKIRADRERAFEAAYHPDPFDDAAFEDMELYKERLRMGYERVKIAMNGQTAYIWVKRLKKPQILSKAGYQV